MQSHFSKRVQKRNDTEDYHQGFWRCTCLRLIKISSDEDVHNPVSGATYVRHMLQESDAMCCNHWCICQIGCHRKRENLPKYWSIPSLNQTRLSDLWSWTTYHRSCCPSAACCRRKTLTSHKPWTELMSLLILQLMHCAQRSSFLSFLKVRMECLKKTLHYAVYIRFLR